MVEAAFANQEGASATESLTVRAAKSFRRRAFDVSLSTAFLIALSPVMLASVLAIYIEDGGPILFSQSRLGPVDEVPHP